MDIIQKLTSPDEKLTLNIEDVKGRLFYELHHEGEQVLRPSVLGLAIKDTRVLGLDLILKDSSTSLVNEDTQQAWGQSRILHTEYNELSLTLQEMNPPMRTMVIRFRLFNDGLAFRYEIPKQQGMDNFAVLQELSEFNVHRDTRAWWIPSFQPDRYEYLFKKTAISEINVVHTPLTLELPGGKYASIHEASLYDYGSLNIAQSEDKGLKAIIAPLSDGTVAQLSAPANLPWRTILVANKAVDLIKSNMMLSLNEPPADDRDFSWVKPMKFMGIWWGMFIGVYTWETGDRHGATTENAIEYIDACKRLGITGLLIEGWNKGWDGVWMENGSEFRFTEPTPDFDIKRITDYARENGVEIVGHHETSGDTKNYEAQLPAAFEFYKNYGIRYVKTGYVGAKMDRSEYHHSQYGVRHYQKTVEMAADYGIMLDIHEPIKGTGIERTWPNVMTREAARGQEYEGGGIEPSHLTVIPFTRMLAGPMDFTPGIFDITNYSKRVTSTLARQLAMYVIIYSPMQMVADRPEKLEGNPAFKFIQDVPVDWEYTLPMSGEIGEYIVIARKDRNSEDWYIGGATNEDAREVSVALDFLDGERTYVAEVYRDGPNAHWRGHQTDITIESYEVSQESELSIRVGHGGGFAVRLYLK